MRKRILFCVLLYLMSTVMIFAQNPDEIIHLSIFGIGDQPNLSGELELVGTINPEGLDIWFIEVAPYDLNNPDGEVFWTPVVLPSQKLRINRTLGIWNTSVHADGHYQLRLHVVLDNGQSLYYRIGPIALLNGGDTSLMLGGLIEVLESPDPAMLPAAAPNANTSVPEIELTLVPSPITNNRLPVEVGGHVLHFDESTQGLMQQAGLTWVKWQLHFNVGDDTLVARDRINRSHAAGFKVILSITGSVDELLQMGTDYYPLFAEYLAEVAALQPDAIEVWNEMNLDREWPAGRISGSAYAQMLQPAYNAIKAVNPNILVITGALAPTGFFGGCTANGCDDDVYYSAMAQAGVQNFADCIGIHYNEGILAPAQLGGDPRGEYPTRYFKPMMDRVAVPFGGSDIPLCFTEMGYLSPEGYGELPGNFAWASNVTVEQQATWLAEAIQMASEYSRKDIRLIIIWNIDFDNIESFLDDPQAGYAIIRADDTCPACTTIGALQAP